MAISQRKQLIIRTIIKEYIKTAQPVSSGILVDKYKLDISPATVRNEMMELEEAGYILVEKSFVGRRPRTTLKLTASGRKAWIAYLDELRRLTGG